MGGKVRPGSSHLLLRGSHPLEQGFGATWHNPVSVRNIWPPTISQPEMESVDYNFPGFQNLPQAPAFEYSTRKGTEEDLVLSGENIIGPLSADNCKNYRGNTRNLYKQEECATLDGLRDFS